MADASPSFFKWTPPPPEQRAAELQRAERQARRAEWKLYVFAIGQCFVATLAGCAVAGAAFATTDRELGEILRLSGMIISWTGNLVALGRLWVRIDQGDV